MKQELANIGIDTNAEVIPIGLDLYIKTKEALEGVLRQFEAYGYRIEHDDNCPDYYHVSVYREVRHVRCRSCGQDIDQGDLYSRDKVCEHCGEKTYLNHDKYRVWDGVEYTEYDRSFPIIEMLSVYATWSWELKQPSPHLHADIMKALHMNPDKGWYDRSRPNQFDAGSRDLIASYIRHFTTLDADEFLRQWRVFRKNVDFIDDFAAFCHPEAKVMDAPNMFNYISLVGKALTGQAVTEEEHHAGVRGMYDPNLINHLFPLDKSTDWDERIEVVDEAVEDVARKNWYLVKQKPQSEEAKRIAGEMVSVATIDRKTGTVCVFTAKMFQNRSGVAIRIPLRDLTDR